MIVSVSGDLIYQLFRLSLTAIYHPVQKTTFTELVEQHVQVNSSDYLYSPAGLSTCTVSIGRQGLALSLITQYDIDRIHAIEDRISEYCRSERVGNWDGIVYFTFPSVCSIADVKFSHNRKGKWFFTNYSFVDHALFKYVSYYAQL